MAQPTPRAGGAGVGGRKSSHVPMRHPNAARRPPQPPPPVASKSAWKFVDRAHEEAESLIQSLMGMCQVNGQPRIDALDKLLEVLNEKPPYGPRACVSLIALKGLATMVSVLGVSCAESRHRASKVLQEAVAYGHGEKVHECRSWLFQVRRNLEHDDPETRASGAALLRVLRPIPECVAAVPLLLRTLKLESLPATEESAGALLQLTADKACIEEMHGGTLIQEMVHHFSSHRSLVVRERCSAVLSALARASSKHRVKIVNNGGVEVLLEGLSPHFPHSTIDTVLQALQNMCLEERARKTFGTVHLADKMFDIVSGKGGFHSSARRRAFSLLETLNKTPEGAPREPYHGIGSLTSEQDCQGLAQLFAMLPTAFICWRVRRVSRCWRKVTSLPETWQKVDFDRCTFMTSIKLKTFLEHAPLTDTTEVSFAGCSKIESIGFSYFAKQMTGRLVLLEMSECQHLKDEELVRLMKTSEGYMVTLHLTGCDLLTNKSMYGIVAHLDTTLRVLVLNRCKWLRDDAIMLLTGACRWLTQLGLSECSGLTSECLGAVSYAQMLTDLDLSLNEFVTDEGITQIASKCTSLTSLDISGCGLVTDKGVNAIANLRCACTRVWLRWHIVTWQVYLP